MRTPIIYANLLSRMTTYQTTTKIKKIYKTNKERIYFSQREQYLRNLSKEIEISHFVDNFPNFTSRQQLTRFMFRHDLFKKITEIKGSIIECGVYAGSGLMSWAQIATILEPMGFFRKIYGFDTFEGFPFVSNKDQMKGLVHKKGDVRSDSYQNLLKCIDLYDQNRLLNQFPKVELVKGDFMETINPFIEHNNHLLVALLYLDFDLYEPTKKALEIFLPRMGKGSVIAFDEINDPTWPGETLALLESMDIHNVSINKFPYEPNMAYLVL